MLLSPPESHLHVARIPFCQSSSPPTSSSLRHCLDFFFFITHHFSLNFFYSSLITRYSSLKIPHPVWHHRSLVITQYFSTVYGPIPITWSEQSYFVGPTFRIYVVHMLRTYVILYCNWLII